jgi:TRAP-type C4-dicarboxylate transport system permease small subunit
MTRIGKMLDFVENALAVIAGLMIVCAMLAVCMDVMLRYLFNRPVGWVLQFSEYVLLYAPFLGAAYVLRYDGHISVDILVGRFGPRGKALFGLWAAILGFGVMCVITYVGVEVTLDHYQRGVPTLGTVRVPEFLVFLAVPLGAAPFALEFLRKAIQQIAALRNPYANSVSIE